MPRQSLTGKLSITGFTLGNINFVGSGPTLAFSRGVLTASDGTQGEAQRLPRTAGTPVAPTPALSPPPSSTRRCRWPPPSRASASESQCRAWCGTRAIDPQEVVSSRERSADRRREQEGRSRSGWPNSPAAWPCEQLRTGPLPVASHDHSRRSYPPKGRNTSKDPSGLLDPHLVGDAGPRKAHELGKRRMRPARAAGQRRDQAGDRGVAVAIERAQVRRRRKSRSRQSQCLPSE
jgi:hypothetical protein